MARISASRTQPRSIHTYKRRYRLVAERRQPKPSASCGTRIPTAGGQFRRMMRAVFCFRRQDVAGGTKNEAYKQPTGDVHGRQLRMPSLWSPAPRLQQLSACAGYSSTLGCSFALCASEQQLRDVVVWPLPLSFFLSPCPSFSQVVSRQQAIFTNSLWSHLQDATVVRRHMQPCMQRMRTSLADTTGGNTPHPTSTAAVLRDKRPRLKPKVSSLLLPSLSTHLSSQPLEGHHRATPPVVAVGRGCGCC